jgi:alpha-galactosidase
MTSNLSGIRHTECSLADGVWGQKINYACNEPTAIAVGSFVLPIAEWSFDNLLDIAGVDEAQRTAFSKNENYYVQCGGWQSWSAGWELAADETLPKKTRIIPELIKLTNRDGDTDNLSQDELVGHFIMYIRAGDTYLCIASKEGGVLPPVSYRINRKERRIVAEVFCPGKQWKAGDSLAELYVFAAQGIFNFKDTLKTLYAPHHSANFPTNVCGYESWYNHYTDISEKLILDDLDALGKTDNLIKLRYIDRGKPVVFQIDDGWEKATGDWGINTARFPSGFAPITAKIASAGYIPGLWLAPLLVTKQACVFKDNPEWLLRDGDGKPVVAGFNPNWDGKYFCLDLSRADVRDYLKALINRVIDEWGFRFLKLDFMYAGLFNGKFAFGGSPYEHYDKACDILTARTQTASGLPVTYLGCGVPFGPSYRHFPLSRIGADTRETWDWLPAKLLRHTGGPGAYCNLMDTIGRSYLNGTIYANDPDVVFLRTKNCKLSDNEKELIALVNFMLAGQIMFSDDPGKMTAADIALTRRIVRLYDALEGDEYGVVRIGRDVFRVESRSGNITGVIDLRKRAITIQSKQE